MNASSTDRAGVADAIPRDVSSTLSSRLSDFDFLDFGASKGGMINWAKARLGGTRGMGIDKDAAKVEVMRDLGHDCLLADATSMELPPDSVRFVTMSHFLEHLRNIATVYRAIECAASVATDFLFIQGPYFDADMYLHRRGLKYYWSDWHGHRCHVTTSLLVGVLESLDLGDYVILGRGIVEDSSHPSIHPLDSPWDQHQYDADVHPAKRLVTFDTRLYMEMVCVVALKPLPYWNEVVTARTECHPIHGTLPYE